MVEISTKGFRKELSGHDIYTYMSKIMIGNIQIQFAELIVRRVLSHRSLSSRT